LKEYQPQIVMFGNIWNATKHHANEIMVNECHCDLYVTDNCA